MKALRICCLAPLLAALSGCFTISSTPYPAVSVVRAAGDVRLRLDGFAATAVVCVPAWAPGGYVVVSQPTDAYRKRAVDTFESAGFVLNSTAAANYIVQAEFFHVGEHPDRAWHALETLFTAGIMFRGGEVYGGRLKVYDAASGKCILVRSYEQAFAAHGWSPIPLFGASGYEPLHDENVKAWCLTAITDRMTADVSAQLAAPAGGRANANANGNGKVPGVGK